MTSLEKAFEEDHERVRKMFKNFENQINGPHALESFNEASSVIKRHMEQEEELFLLIHNKSEDLDKAITIVKSQHMSINDMLESIDHSKDPEDIRYKVINLNNYLDKHEQYEEEVLYKLADEILSERERARLVERLRF